MKIIKWQKKFNLKFYSKSPDASLPSELTLGFQTSKLINKINNEIFMISSLNNFCTKKQTCGFFDMIKNEQKFNSR